MSIFGVKWSKSRGKSVLFDLGKSVKSKRITAAETGPRRDQQRKICFYTNVKYFAANLSSAADMSSNPQVIVLIAQPITVIRWNRMVLK